MRGFSQEARTIWAALTGGIAFFDLGRIFMLGGYAKEDIVIELKVACDYCTEDQVDDG